MDDTYKELASVLKRIRHLVRDKKLDRYKTMKKLTVEISCSQWSRLYFHVKDSEDNIINDYIGAELYTLEEVVEYLNTLETRIREA